MENTDATNQLLKNKYKLDESPEVKVAAARAKARTGEWPKRDPLSRIQNYLTRFQEITDREDPKQREHGIDAFKTILHRKYIIKPNEIPEGYFENQRMYAESRLRRKTSSGLKVQSTLLSRRFKSWVAGKSVDKVPLVTKFGFRITIMALKIFSNAVPNKANEIRTRVYSLPSTNVCSKAGVVGFCSRFFQVSSAMEPKSLAIKSHCQGSLAARSKSCCSTLSLAVRSSLIKIPL